ncbi:MULTISPECIES: phosphotransferase family protein [Rhodococcus]|uniref:phosphotransferase family protein n=1 Tax=Rhodococcus TaxID=1827 RepID=UPI0005733E0F|nr:MULTISPECIES: phosphotransferase family protein [Rhodococcus]KHJ74443.1 acyl-CoA dehydrogenase [Rhodococcus sp. Chr-9]QXF82422.1 phosphotransferase family protein [Rhodococcus pyridinivorans]UPK61786.1 phosphotransferase family protein [Rhodococcus pyridinivorans]
MTAVHEGLDLAVLERFLADSGVTVHGELRAELISGGKSNLTYGLRDEKSHWVLRRPPTTGLTPSAHDVAREFRITSALKGTGVPVAPTVAQCEDDSVMGAPFTVVEFVDGRVVRSKADLDALGDDEIDRCVGELVRIIAELHNVDFEAVGLGGLGRPDGYVTRQVKLWASQWGRVKTRELPDLERLHAALAESIPESPAPSIVHGDYRIDNTILDPNDPARVVAVVDWELSTLGDPLTDLAMMCVYRHPALDDILGFPAAWSSERLPAADDLVQRYATASGRDIADWNFYMGLAYLKLAVIAEGINHRWRAGATIGDGFDRAGEAVPDLVAAGLAALKGAHA